MAVPLRRLAASGTAAAAAAAAGVLLWPQEEVGVAKGRAPVPSPPAAGAGIHDGLRMASFSAGPYSWALSPPPRGVAHCDSGAAGAEPPSPLAKAGEYEQQALALAARVRAVKDAGEEALQLRVEKQGAKIYALKAGTMPGPDALAVARVGSTYIEAPAREVADLWWHFGSRSSWDALNTADCQVVSEAGPYKLVYLLGKPKPLISARDFAYAACRLPPAQLGLPAHSFVFAQVDAHGDVPPMGGAVRGRVNSVLVVVPEGTGARVEYFIEMTAGGWLPRAAVELAANDVPMAIAMMKKHIEPEASAEALGDVDKAAQLRYHAHLALESSEAHSRPSVATDVTASRSELEAALVTMRAALARATDADLVKRIKADIAKVEARIRGSK